MTTKIEKVIKQWAEENDTDCGGYVDVYGIPYAALASLESILADLFSDECPSGGCHSDVFDEE